MIKNNKIKWNEIKISSGATVFPRVKRLSFPVRQNKNGLDLEWISMKHPSLLAPSILIHFLKTSLLSSSFKFKIHSPPSLRQKSKLEAPAGQVLLPGEDFLSLPSCIRQVQATCRLIPDFVNYPGSLLLVEICLECEQARSSWRQWRIKRHRWAFLRAVTEHHGVVECVALFVFLVGCRRVDALKLSGPMYSGSDSVVPDISVGALGRLSWNKQTEGNSHAD